MSDHGNVAASLNVRRFLLGYAALLLSGSIIYSIGYATFVFGSLRASRSIHNRLVDSILGTTLRSVTNIAYPLY